MAPSVVGLFFIWGFLKDDILACAETWDQFIELSGRILVSFRGFFLKIIFLHSEIFEFHNSSFALRCFINVNGKATVWHTPLFFFYYGDSLDNCNVEWRRETGCHHDHPTRSSCSTTAIKDHSCHTVSLPSSSFTNILKVHQTTEEAIILRR